MGISFYDVGTVSSEGRDVLVMTLHKATGVQRPVIVTGRRPGIGGRPVARD
jgi:hypothetical protein